MKRALAVLLAVGLLAAAYAVSRTIETGRARTVRLEASRSAEAAGMRAADALAAHVGELKLEAQNAAQNPRLVAALRGNADAATLQDLFRTEQWWEPYRNAFKVYAVAFEGDKLDVIVGMENADFASDLLIREARERHEAVAEIVMGKGWPYAAAAALVDLPGKSVPAVLLLARPIEEGALRKLAEKARGAVLLSDGTRAVLEAGPEPERELLRAAIGAEKRGPIYQPPEGNGPIWAAAVSSVVPGLWLWTYGAGAARRTTPTMRRSSPAPSSGRWRASWPSSALALGLRRRESAATTRRARARCLAAGADTVRASGPARAGRRPGPGLASPAATRRGRPDRRRRTTPPPRRTRPAARSRAWAAASASGATS